MAASAAPLEEDSPQFHAVVLALPADDALVLHAKEVLWAPAAARVTELLFCEEEGASGLATVFALVVIVPEFPAMSFG